MKIDISFLSPTSIFEEEILITAKNEIGDKALIEFKGIEGISESAKGDRFYFKSDKDIIYSVNVLSISNDVEL